MNKHVYNALVLSLALCSCRQENSNPVEADFATVEISADTLSADGTQEEVDTAEGEATPHRFGNLNQNVNSKARKNAENLSLPRFNKANSYKEYYVDDADDEEVFNYAVEWNDEMKGANWVAYEFNNVTRVKKDIARSNKWDWDSSLSSKSKVNNWMHSSNGFDKGHICAAMDRDYSTEAKDQTFYYSNCFPQIGVNFNQGYWNFLEIFFRRWCTSKEFDHVYVTKGGTLNKLLKNFKGKVPQNNIYPSTDKDGYTERGLPVPKYFFMAILAQKGDSYKAMGFYVEHKEYEDRTYTAKDFKKVAMSIDQLEELTGLDLFCNLPDKIEKEIEANYDEKSWKW